MRHRMAHIERRQEDEGTTPARTRSARRPHRLGQLLASVSTIVAMLAFSLTATVGTAQAVTTTYTGISVMANGHGYALITNIGQVYAFGDVQYRANPTGFSGTMVGISVTADGQGYAAVSSTGQVYAYGTVVPHGNPTGFTGTIVGISVTADGSGYAVISSTGQVYAYGVTPHGNPTGFSGHIVGISVTADGHGYTAISSTGQVYAYGTVVPHGNPTGFTGTIVGITVTGDGNGYAAISSTGQVYAYGVTFRGNPSGFTGSIAGISATSDGRGYAAVSSSGQVYAYTPVVYYGNGTAPPSQKVLQDKVVSWAKKILNGDATPSVAGSTPWPGGLVSYSWSAGHGVIGPSYGICGQGTGYTGSVPCDSGLWGDPHSTIGVDCSGFTHWVYSLAANKDVLDGNSTTQRTMFGGAVTTAPIPGDLVFYTGHVGVYIGNDTMINASHTPSYIEEDGVSTHTGEGPPVFVHYSGS